jgi:20S proteasome alpha/beta subunit
MTVCIAAVCRQNDEPAIVICADEKISSELGSAETAFKMGLIGGNRWTCLTAGPESDILSLKRFVDAELGNAGDIDETNLIPRCTEALRKRKSEKATMFTSSRFGMTYENFLEKGKMQLPEDVFRAATLDIINLINRAEMIICGFAAGGVPHLCKIPTNGVVVFQESFAVIGEGQNLATASLLRREQHEYSPIARTLYNVFEAKRYSERISSVGEKTDMIVMYNAEIKSMTESGFSNLRTIFKEYGPKEIDEISLDLAAAIK